MQYLAILQAPEQALSDVYVSIQDSAGASVVARAPADLLPGSAGTYGALLELPDGLSVGREVWDSVEGDFAALYSDLIVFSALNAAQLVTELANFSTPDAAAFADALAQHPEIAIPALRYMCIVRREGDTILMLNPETRALVATQSVTGTGLDAEYGPIVRV